MKNLIFLFLSLFSTTLLFSQSDVPERQIGFDATAFITRFLSFNAASSGISNPEILFLYRKEKDGKHLRYGIGGNLIYRTTKTSNQTREDVSARLDFKFGREYHKDFSKKWRSYLGWDVLLGAFESSSETTNNNQGSTSKYFSRGGNLRVNPLVGIQFFLNNRLSFSTEMAYGLDVEALFNSDSQKRYTIKTFYAPPISLFLNYRI